MPRKKRETANEADANVEASPPTQEPTNVEPAVETIAVNKPVAEENLDATVEVIQGTVRIEFGSFQKGERFTVPLSRAKRIVEDIPNLAKIVP